MSDGSAAPAELIALAEREKLAGIALTDHDTVAGLAPAAAEAEQYPELTFVPGVEVSAAFKGGTMHILGLCLDVASAALEELGRALREAREQRNPKMIKKLQKQGVAIDLDEVIAEARAEDLPADQRVVGRAHMAAVMVRNGSVRSIREAFQKYLSPGCAAYVDKERLKPAEVIDAIHAAGGQAILAHPVQLRCQNHAQYERIIRNLHHHGLDGIEAYHSDHFDRETRYFLDLAKRLGLAVTGGSDFHGAIKPTVTLGHPRVPVQFLHELLARAGRG